MDEKYGVKHLFANVNGERKHISQVESGDLGLCPLCNRQLRAYHGEKNQWHWRHVNSLDCDPWHEGKTPWHQGWQDKFPREWQEVPMRNETERHLADVRTLVGTVIECQHSPMDRETRQIRERFYGNMLWVIDGDAKKRMLDHFLENQNGRIEHLNQTPFWLVKEVATMLPAEWCESDKLVIFDFSKLPNLVALLPGKIHDGRRIIFKISRESFVEKMRARQILPCDPPEKIIAAINNLFHPRPVIVPQLLSRPQKRPHVPPAQYHAMKKSGYDFRTGRF